MKRWFYKIAALKGKCPMRWFESLTERTVGEEIHPTGPGVPSNHHFEVKAIKTEGGQETLVLDYLKK